MNKRRNSCSSVAEEFHEKYEYTIRLSRDTFLRLQSHSAETYDDTLNRLMDLDDEKQGLTRISFNKK